MLIDELGLSTKDTTVEIELKNGKKINVKQYLPAEEKNNLLEIVIQQADTNTIVNSFALEVLFHLYLVLKYTDIAATPEQLANPLPLYDILESNGIINEVIASIPASEYETLTENLETMIDSYQTYSISPIVLFDKVGKFVGMVSEEVKKIKPEDLKAMVEAFKPAQ